jgi:hypothetical protein
MWCVLFCFPSSSSSSSSYFLLFFSASSFFFFLFSQHQLTTPILSIGNSARLVEEATSAANASLKGKEPAAVLRHCGGSQPLGRLRRVHLRASIPQDPKRWSPTHKRPLPDSLQRLNHCAVHLSEVIQRRFYRLGCKSNPQRSESGGERLMVHSAGGILVYSHQLRYGHYCLDMQLMTAVIDCTVGILSNPASQVEQTSTVRGDTLGDLWEKYSNIVGTPTTELGSAHVRCFYSLHPTKKVEDGKLMCELRYAVNGVLLDHVCELQVQCTTGSQVSGCVPAVRFNSTSVVLIWSEE